MNRKYIAYCTEISEFQDNKILNGEYASIFPGAFWIYLLYIKFKDINIGFITGDVAVLKIKENEISPNDIYIIQEMNSFHGKSLLKLGCNAFLLINFESPLYAYNFYDNLNKIASPFWLRILFDVRTLITTKNNINEILRFPNYKLNELKSNLIDWSKRDFMALVASNKYFSNDFNIPKYKKLKSYYYWIKDLFLKYTSNSRKIAIENELLTERRNYIKFLCSLNKLDVYGNNWDLFFKENKLPFNCLKGECVDKKDTISKYKFALCFENTRSHGYITEKIIDCFVSNVIPIYFGAPDILDFIPSSAFIDASRFNSVKDLYTYIASITEESADEILREGKNFISKNPIYSFEGFSEYIFLQFLNLG
jgi:hypothetical protein